MNIISHMKAVVSNQLKVTDICINKQLTALFDTNVIENVDDIENHISIYELLKGQLFEVYEETKEESENNRRLVSFTYNGDYTVGYIIRDHLVSIKEVFNTYEVKYDNTIGIKLSQVMFGEESETSINIEKGTKIYTDTPILDFDNGEYVIAYDESFNKIKIRKCDVIILETDIIEPSHLIPFGILKLKKCASNIPIYNNAYSMYRCDEIDTKCKTIYVPFIDYEHNTKRYKVLINNCTRYLDMKSVTLIFDPNTKRLPLHKKPIPYVNKKLSLEEWILKKNFDRVYGYGDMVNDNMMAFSSAYKAKSISVLASPVEGIVVNCGDHSMTIMDMDLYTHTFRSVNNISQYKTGDVVTVNSALMSIMKGEVLKYEIRDNSNLLTSPTLLTVNEPILYRYDAE